MNCGYNIDTNARGIGGRHCERVEAIEVGLSPCTFLY